MSFNSSLKELQMRIGLSYDLKETIPVVPNGPGDALEEYDSAETVELIAGALETPSHPVVMLGGGRELLDKIRSNNVDIVFNIAEGRGNYRSREAQVPSVLEMLDIPYTGSDPQCLAISLDKPLTNKLVGATGVHVPESYIITGREDIDRLARDEFPFPGIIKPAYEGSSKGISLDSIITVPAQLGRVVPRLLDYYRQPVMLEQYIAGDEVTVGLVGNSPPEVLGMMRIVPRGGQSQFVYSVEVKRDYQKLVDYECPARLGAEVLQSITESSIKVFKVLGCRDFARVDFRVTAEGIPYFLEINPLPGLGTHSDLVIMALKLGWTHRQLIAAVLDAALKRYPQCVSA
jgi:D-alanine-D-alanine ligase